MEQEKQFNFTGFSSWNEQLSKEMNNLDAFNNQGVEFSTSTKPIYKLDYEQIKLPTYKELGFNIKEVLRIEQPNTFKDLLNKWGETMSFSLNRWCELNNCKDKRDKIWNIIFYHSFLNFKREQRVKNLLKNYGFLEIEDTNLWEDGIMKIDLKAKNATGKTLFFQIKPRYNKAYFTLYNRLKNFCIKKDAIPVLVVEFTNDQNKKYFVFYNLFTNEKTSLKGLL